MAKRPTMTLDGPECRDFDAGDRAAEFAAEYYRNEAVKPGEHQAHALVVARFAARQAVRQAWEAAVAVAEAERDTLQAAWREDMDEEQKARIAARVLTADRIAQALRQRDTVE